MSLTVTTWNINSVRLRFPIVKDFLLAHAPDVLCLQETKTPDDRFPAGDFARLGYVHQAFIGNKGYNGVAILSKLPFEEPKAIEMCGKADARHISATFTGAAGAAAGVTLHNFYVPAGGDEADPEINPKFRHKLDFLAHMDRWAGETKATARPAILVGDLNIAPYMRAMSGATSSSSTWSATPRSRPRRWRGCAPIILGSTRCAGSSPSPNGSTPGGAIARRIGRRPIAAAGSTMSGSRPISPPTSIR